MKGYLLDTCICVFLLRNKFNIEQKVNQVGFENCYLSAVTAAELKFGAYKSDDPNYNLSILKEFLSLFKIIPFETAIDIYAKEKARLCSIGKPIEDFDLLIGSTAVSENLTLVTDNTKHFVNIENLTLENWISR